MTVIFARHHEMRKGGRRCKSNEVSRWGKVHVPIRRAVRSDEISSVFVCLFVAATDNEDSTDELLSHPYCSWVFVPYDLPRKTAVGSSSSRQRGKLFPTDLRRLCPSLCLQSQTLDNWIFYNLFWNCAPSSLAIGHGEIPALLASGCAEPRTT